MATNNQDYEDFKIVVHELDETAFENSGMFTEILKKMCKSFVQIGPQKMLISKSFINNSQIFTHFQFRPDDVLIMGHPRSGTTMTQEVLWLVFNQFNVKEAEAKNNTERVPLLEAACLIPEEANELAEKFRNIELTKILLNSPKNFESNFRRVMKTHLHVDVFPNLLENGCKVIYIARNPKDVAVSYYHIYRNMVPIEIDFSSFLKLFMSGLTYFGPYWAHIKQAWDNRYSENMLFFFYEDFYNNQKLYIKKILNFVGESVTPFQLELLSYILNFDNFKKYMSQGVEKTMNEREDVEDDFIRKGKINGWTNYFTEEMNQVFDQWVQENSEKIGIKFPQY